MAFIHAPSGASADRGCFNGVQLRWLKSAPLQWDMLTPHREITVLNNQHDTSLSQDGSDSIGLTVANVSCFRNAVVASNGCSEIHIGVGYTHMEVKIARELMKNACAVEHVRAHELKHVAIYQHWLDKMKREMPDKISKYLLKNPHPTEEALSQFVRSEWMRVVLLHRELDSNDEYRENKYACDGAIRRLLRYR